jgi:hypothetical protein
MTCRIHHYWLFPSLHDPERDEMSDSGVCVEVHAYGPPTAGVPLILTMDTSALALTSWTGN